MKQYHFVNEKRSMAITIMAENAQVAFQHLHDILNADYFHKFKLDQIDENVEHEE